MTASAVLSVAASFAVFVSLWKAIVVIGGYRHSSCRPRSRSRRGSSGAGPTARSGRTPSTTRRGRPRASSSGRRRRSSSATASPVGARRARRVAVHRRRPGDADPRPGPAARAVVRPGLTSKVVICGLIVFFPIAVATMVGIRSVDAGCSSWPARSGRPAPGPDDARGPGGAAVDPRRAAGRGRRSRSSARSSASGPGAEQGLGVLVNLARGSLFDIPLMFATLVTIALLGIASISSSSSSNAGSSAFGSPAPWRSHAPRPRLVLVAASSPRCSSRRATTAPTPSASSRRGARPRRRSRRPRRPADEAHVGLGYIPSVQFAQFYLADQAGYYATRASTSRSRTRSTRTSCRRSARARSTSACPTARA
jgi:hypothetical protein